VSEHDRGEGEPHGLLNHGDVVAPPPSARPARRHAIRRELASAYRDMRANRVSPQDGTRLAYVLDLLRKACETALLEERLVAVEQVLNYGELDDKGDRIYAKLTATERASLTFTHMVSHNEGEVAAIIRSIPRGTYHGLDLEYGNRVDGLLAMASYWAIQHWRSRQTLTEAMLWTQMADANDHVTNAELNPAMRYFDGQLFVLDNALEEVGRDNNVSADDIRAFAEAEVYEPIYSEAPAGVAALVRILTRLLTAS
jgi:hypothetical protein